MLEKVLERIAKSKYSKHFIIKGGFLIAAMVGISYRSTMDIDATIKNYPLTKENIEKIFKEICALEDNDGISFSFVRTETIRDNDEYEGFRVHLKGNYSPMSVDLKLDITTGDMITPNEVTFEYQGMFEEGYIDIFAYNVETILAEKLETIITRSVATTRIRDYYDIYLLLKLHEDRIDYSILKLALERTCQKRMSKLDDYEMVCDFIVKDDVLNAYWITYQSTYKYAENITFKECVQSVRFLLRQCSHTNLS